MRTPASLDGAHKYGAFHDSEETTDSADKMPAVGVWDSQLSEVTQL